ncbi:NAD(P)H-hydrate dehydratase [Roseicyclus marinus]|uniref:NAD(P)H-hydrate dehydratase n=1 Tax=Roseicyclus marinus TaxID=2161673 RepID=UPI00240FE4A2|nr:NAD(P)H-hydrate dehydratase [Roseicyclus marinus]MDG3042921.1 NAD(P)H-hydrate dehydratase [Roseicyclus marinus]
MGKLETTRPDLLLTAAEMRAAEQAAFATGRATGLDLMERAGRGTVDALFATWPDLAATTGHALVLCGPGNNGGDGFVIARVLKGWGWSVDVALLGDPARLPPDAATNHARWSAMGPFGALPHHLPQPLPGVPCVVIDALFGTGLTRGLGADLAQALLSRLEGPVFRDVRRVAVDIPSGLCADSGRVLANDAGTEPCLRADLTVTFHAAKRGHVLSSGPDLCGRLVVCDIGIADGAGEGAEDAPPGPARLIGAPRAADILKPSGHKYDHGHALVFSGGFGRSGAARLAARAALRIGAGLVTVAAPPEAMAECASQLTAIMLREIPDAAACTSLLADQRLSALCLGPGLGLDAARALVPLALAARRPLVLDADALSAFAEDPAALFTALHPGVILTPHDGEFARLFPDLARRLADAPTVGPAYGRIDAARDAAARAGCTLLLKGRDTIIADASGTCRVHAATGHRAAPWLATAGAGDVLAGFITGLLARGLAPMAAAQAAAWLHVEAARHVGPGLIAEDLSEALPHVLRRLAGGAPGQAGMVSTSAEANSNPSA